MQKLLSHIDNPEDLRRLPPEDLPQLIRELRAFIIDAVAEQGGHLGASLGVVELTVALHYIFNTPQDRVIWDVGHQAYGHKIVTGRREAFRTNRQWGGLSGFPKRTESEYDSFGTGHSSTSLSAILGMALASQLKQEERKHIAVIGDASLASGMAFEALNHLGVSQADVLVVLNDNGMSIDPSVGAMHQLLCSGGTGIQNWFESLGIHYFGPFDGHDIYKLLEELKVSASLKGPRLIHLKTVKGKGLSSAEKDQVTFHAPGKFEPETGERFKEQPADRPPKFQEVFGETLVELGRMNASVVGVTPAMPTGSSLNLFMKVFPDRSWDVGIAEQHAVTLSAGLAAEGLLPFCAIYSTFLQRAYDQLIHDVALQNLRVVFCIDRAGLVGQDGATHHGVFDLAYLNCIPNMSVLAPRNGLELRQFLYTVQEEDYGPVAIRYPRGRCLDSDWKQEFSRIHWGKGVCLRKGTHKAVLFLGPLGEQLLKWLEENDSEGRVGLYDLRFLKPLDKELVSEVFDQYQEILTLEDGALKGGLGSSILQMAQSHPTEVCITTKGLADEFVEQGKTEELYKQTGLSVAEIGLELLR